MHYVGVPVDPSSFATCPHQCTIFFPSCSPLELSTKDRALRIETAPQPEWKEYASLWQNLCREVKVIAELREKVKSDSDRLAAARGCRLRVGGSQSAQLFGQVSKKGFTKLGSETYHAGSLSS